MKAEEQRIAIAKVCGWTFIHEETDHDPDNARFFYLAGKHPKEAHRGDCKVYYKWEVPNYLSDLNAMHEAEKVMTSAQMDEYAQHVYSIVARDGVRMTYGISAPAAQRAEAFLRTLNLWKPAPPPVTGKETA